MNKAVSIFIGILIVVILAAVVLWVGNRSDYEDILEEEDLLEDGERADHESVPEEDLVQESEEVFANDQEEINMNQKATLKTTKGDIVLEFYPELAPNAVRNFQSLAEQGFYEGVIFHRVIENFMIQGGDPTGTGRGGPGYTFDDEFDPGSEIAKQGYTRGTLAMANSGPNTNGSQFFIMHKDYPLPYQYTIFGRVTEGMDVVDAIATTNTDSGDRPLEDIVINEVVLSVE